MLSIAVRYNFFSHKRKNTHTIFKYIFFCFDLHVSLSMHTLCCILQDMACDTFLKIAQKCKRKFMTPQVEDPQPFILTLIADLQRHIGDLQPHQVDTVMTAVPVLRMFLRFIVCELQCDTIVLFPSVLRNRVLY